MTNRLANESSPYLLQHRENPVDWYPWGPEALARSRAEQKPIFLSIGYSACHWCHVMEHESFENESIAAVLNENFVPIKVDREERPDLDQIYMNAVQMLTGRGGWPMSVFLTPALEPFYGGTYWPPSPRMGMPGFDQVLDAVSDAWENRRDQATRGAAELANRMREVMAAPAEPGELSEDLLLSAAQALRRLFDRQYGGFGGAPKFPHSMDLQVLLRVWRRTQYHPKQRDDLVEMVQITLDRMAAGGIYDHLGGGFARYSVDARWLVPHFEKMLYDNALLVGAYLDAYLVTQEARYAQVVRETLDYIVRDMTDPAGGIYSTEDADSEGEEGKFYVWTVEEIESALGAERAKTFCYAYDVTPGGNFEGKSILNLPKTLEQCAQILQRDVADLTAELQASKQVLLEIRNQRVRPGLDDKVLVSWNGLMIDSLARASSILQEPRYLQAATAAADFLLKELRQPNGRLYHTWRHGVAKLDAYLDDYTALINALVSVYEASFDEHYITAAVRLAEIVLDQFHDSSSNDATSGGFFYTARDHEQLIARVKDLYDSSVPSGNSLAATALLRLGKLTGERRYLEAAHGTLETAASLMERSPTGTGQMLLALDFLLGPTYEIAILGDPQSTDTRAALDDLHRRFLPNKVVALRSSSATNQSEGHITEPLEALFAGKQVIGAGPTVYICQSFSCSAPSEDLSAIKASWERLAAS